MKEATPADAKGEALHGDRGFVGDFQTHGGVFRLFAEPDDNEVIVTPVSDVTKEFTVDATLGRKRFRNAFFGHAKDLTRSIDGFGHR